MENQLSCGCIKNHYLLYTTHQKPPTCNSSEVFIKILNAIDSIDIKIWIQMIELVTAP